MKLFKVITLVLIQALVFSKMIDLKSKDISWIGDKVIGNGHSGVVKIKKGSLNIKDGVLGNATIVADMNTIRTTDIEGEWALKLDAHLKNDDFFSVNKFPESKLAVRDSVKLVEGANKVRATLFIKDKKDEIILLVKKKGSNLDVNFEFDRTKFGVKYNSTNFFKGLGDKAIKDKVRMSFKLKI
ncbi:MAG: hypothetical protein BM556_13415 [Bacteriovorax sp. MedPE-SWde]|nr:MAG: hypothetical protein BM556_13415 [Bacteriovorax sp. MedPE-SWde]